MSKKSWYNGQFLTPTDMTNIVGYDANTGHHHTGLDQDGSVPKVNLTTEVSGPLNINSDATANTIYAEARVLSNYVQPTTPSAGYLGDASRMWGSSTINYLTINTQIGPSTPHGGIVGNFGASYIDTMYGTCYPPATMVNVNSFLGDLGNVYSGTLRVEIMGNHAFLRGSEIYGSHGTGGKMRWQTDTGTWPFSFIDFTTLYPVYVVTSSAHAGATISDYGPGAFRFVDSSVMQFYSINNSTGLIDDHSFVSQNYCGIPTWSAVIALT